eukprot:5987842-Pyramimonas_sp.AAC.1
MGDNKRRRTVDFPVRQDDELEDQIAAGRELLVALQGLYCTGRLEATSFCSLVYLAAKAGAKIDLSWGKRPHDASRGHCQEVIDRKLHAEGYHQTVPLILSIPGHTTQNRSRRDLRLHVRPFHELLWGE